MKCSIVLVCVVLAVVAEPPVPQDGQLSSQYGVPSSAYGAPSGRGRPRSQYGAPSGYGDDDGEPANYEFKYDVEDQEAGLRFGHTESRQGEIAQGDYYVLLPDGRTQHVQYVADQDGYHPKISYEEGQGGYARGPSGGYSRGGPSTAGYRK